jgi:hypothetical protein
MSRNLLVIVCVGAVLVLAVVGFRRFIQGRSTTAREAAEMNMRAIDEFNRTNGFSNNITVGSR